LVSLIIAGRIEGRTITVGLGGGYDFNTIQWAIEDSNDGDTVLVADGTYTGDGNRDIDFKGKGITVRSENGPENCIIDCNGTESEPHRGFYFHSGEGPDSILEGLSIKEGVDEFYGGAIACNNSGPTITTCVLTDNFTLEAGGAIACRNNSNPTISHSTVEGNSAPYGGAIECWNSTPIITHCTFIDNRANIGGALFYSVTERRDTLTVIINCLFVGNLALGEWAEGGGVCVWGYLEEDVVMRNCTFVRNSASHEGGGFYSVCGNTEIVGCIFWDNSAAKGAQIAAWHNVMPPCVLPGVIRDCDVQGSRGGTSGLWAFGEGNIDSDPCFAERGYWDPNGTPDDANDDLWVDGDYHLKSEAGRWDPNKEGWVQDGVTSPCIDGGDPMSPIALEPFPNGGMINMGAYGGTAEASKSYFGEPVCETILAGDINGDCQVDLEDFRIMALHWLEEK